MIKRLSIFTIIILNLSLKGEIPQDSLQIQYAIVGMSFFEDHDVIKIKVPPWIKSSDLIPQIKRAVIWPGQPAPVKTTYVYVFKETDQVGDVSQTGAIYQPDKGFIWNLASWIPAQIPSGIPTKRDLEIYYDLIDQIIQDGSSLQNQKIRSSIAEEYSLTIHDLDSIYVFVKYWLAEEEKKHH
jgi:hypothetical protein